MSEERKKTGFFLISCLIVGFVAVMTFTAAITPELAQVKPPVPVGGGIGGGAGATVGGIAIPGAIPAGSATGPSAAAGGGEGFVSAPQSVDMNTISQLVRPVPPPEGFENDRPLTGLDDEQYMALKARVAKLEAAGLLGAKPRPVGPAGLATPRVPTKAGTTAQVTGKPFSVGWTYGFYGQGETAACGGCVPPDMALAVSENFVVQVVNTAIAIYDKTGHIQAGFPKSADTFFNLTAGTYTTDPRAFYDWANHRFFVVMLTETSPTSGTNTGSLIWAVSKTQDPRGGWWVYSPFQVGNSGECPDYPTLGHDTTNWGTYATKGGIYIGINQFSGSGHCTGAGLSTNYVFFMPKDALYSGAGFGFWYFTGLNVGGTLVDTLQPYNVTDRADKPSSIFLTNSYNIKWGGGACSTGCNGLWVWAVSGPTTGSVIAPNNPFAFLQGGNGPILTAKSVATTFTYTLPPLAAEPGCTASSGPCVDTNDTRISGGVKYHAGELFGSLNTGVSHSPAVAGPIWFELHPVTDINSQITSLEKRQEDCFECGNWANNGSAWFATVQPDQENNLVMVFDYSTDTAYPGMVFTSRRANYGDSLMNGAGSYLVGGAANYFSGRWGDYTATAPDFTIATRGLLWFSAQYSDASGKWGTAIGAAQYNLSSDQ
jgi:hypothetical protein